MHLRPLTSDFVHIPKLAIKCHLAWVSSLIIFNELFETILGESKMVGKLREVIVQLKGISVSLKSRHFISVF